MQAYHLEGTNITKVGSLGEPRASHTICSIQAFRWEDDGYYQGSRSNVIPSFRVLGKRPLLLAARSFHRIDLYLALSSHYRSTHCLCSSETDISFHSLF